MSANEPNQPPPNQKLPLGTSLVITLVSFCIAVAAFSLLVRYQSEMEGFQGIGLFLVLVLVGFAVAAFIFGAMQSTASFTGKQFSGNLSLGGPIVGLALVIVGGYYFQKNMADVSNRPSGQSVSEIPFDLDFFMDYAPDNDAAVTKDTLVLSPIVPPGKEQGLAPIPGSGTGSQGHYVVPNLRLPGGVDRYNAKLVRSHRISYNGNISSIPKVELCIEPSKNLPAAQTLEAKFIIEMAKGLVNPVKDSSTNWFALCRKTASIASPGSWFETPVVHAQGSTTGWIVPSLQTLRARHDTEGLTYTSFKISATDLTSLSEASAYSYELRVNGTPVFVEGLTKADRRLPFDAKRGFELEFGLENLDFSGANKGQESIETTIEFYSGQKLVKAVHLNRSYVALRGVTPAELIDSGTKFTWTGDYRLGKAQDGFQVLISSSNNLNEIVGQKNNFDAAKATFEGKRAVAVVRPPLPPNPAAGMIIGFYDEVGKIRFTFSSDEARRVLNWVKTDPKTRPLVRSDSFIRPLNGNN